MVHFPLDKRCVNIYRCELNTRSAGESGGKISKLREENKMAAKKKGKKKR
jgi:hypothetical protein